MRINHNISSMVTQSSLYQVGQSMSKSLQRLSTGLRVNTAADDAAGLGVSENLRAQVNGLNQAQKNTQDAISLLNIADGALNEQSSILQRMRELVVQALNDSYSSTERSYMGQEFGALRQELDRIAATTNYNKMQIFATPEITTGNPVYAGSNVNGEAARTDSSGALVNPADPLFGADDLTSSNHFNMLIGANYDATDAAALNVAHNFFGSGASDMVSIQFGQMDANGLLSIAPQVPGSKASDLWNDFGWNPDLVGFTNSDSLIAVSAEFDGDVATAAEASVQTKLQTLLKVIDGSSDLKDNMKAIALGGNIGDTYKTGFARINEMRARIGAMTNRFEHAVNNTQNQATAQQSAESLIRDVDFAKETATFTKNQILTQSATAMLSQANSMPQGVLQLLK